MELLFIRNVNCLDPWVQLLVGLVFLGLAIFCFSKDKGLNLSLFFMCSISTIVILPFSISELLRSLGYNDHVVVDFNFNFLFVLLFFTTITLLRLAFATRKKIDFF